MKGLLCIFETLLKFALKTEEIPDFFLYMEPRWYFSREKICDSPNMKFFQDPDKEMACRIRATTFLQLIGHKLKLSTNCIGIATVYFHRFYMFFSFEDVNEKKLAMVAIFLSCKAQNEFRKLEHIIKVAFAFMDPRFSDIDVESEFYSTQKDFLLCLENVLLQVLGFEVDVELPHPYIIKICQYISGSEELVTKSYFLATASLTSSTLCLQCTPVTVACVCIHLSARWCQFQIDSGAKERPWFYFFVASLTEEYLIELTDELEKTILIGASKIKSPVLIGVIKEFLMVEKPPGTPETSASENEEKLPIETKTFPTRSSKRKRLSNDSIEILVKS